MELFEILDDSKLEDIIEEFKNHPDVEYAQPNYELKTSSVPNDSRYSEQGALNKISASEAWNITKGSNDVIAAVLDTGIDINHEDLKNSIWLNTKEIPGNGLDDDNNGYVDDVNGINVIDKTAAVFSSVYEDYHGTAVTGIIAAEQNNSAGIS